MKKLQLLGCYIFILINQSYLFAQNAQVTDFEAKCTSGNCQFGQGELIILNKHQELTDRLIGEFSGGKIVKGSHYKYSLGLAAGAIEQDEGLFQDFILTEGTVRLFNYGIKDSIFDTKIFTPKGYCISGNCITGVGKWVRLKPGFSSDEIIINEGNFKDGYFVTGTATVEGVDTLLDGSYIITKYNYHPAHNQAFSDVVFIPKNYNDKIKGTWHPDANPSFFKIPFFLADDYYEKGNAGSNFHFKAKGLPAWIIEVYRPISIARNVVADAASHERRVQELRYDMEIHPNNYISNNTYAPSTEGKSSRNLTNSSFSKCSVCNGNGYTVYDCGQGGGHPCRKYCTACNGTGQVHN